MPNVALPNFFGSPSGIGSASTDPLPEACDPSTLPSAPVLLTGDPGTIIKSGLLKKHASRHVTGAWQQRFVVLEGSPTHVLIYYGAAAATDPTAAKPRGVMPLAEVTVQRHPKEQNTFVVRAPARSYELRATSGVEADEWVHAIDGAVEVARLAKARASTPAPSLSWLSHNSSLEEVPDALSRSPSHLVSPPASHQQETPGSSDSRSGSGNPPRRLSSRLPKLFGKAPSFRKESSWADISWSSSPLSDSDLNSNGRRSSSTMSAAAAARAQSSMLEGAEPLP
jgi:hypothetical protein